jgi:tetratricopeptide (TPR) repeat protein
MKKAQWILIMSSVVVFVVFYFVLDTKSQKQKSIEKSRLLNMELTSMPSLLMESKKLFTTAQLSGVISLEQKLIELSDTDTLSRIKILKDLSGEWYKLGKSEIAAGYAVEVAELEDSEESWSIAGTTFTICIQNAEDEKILNFCSSGAVQAFEKAISINPSNLAHRVNLALSYVENPTSKDPMKGIKMLMDLNQSNPGEPVVLNTLAVLALKTGQNDRALERLRESYQRDSTNGRTICLLAQAYETIGDKENEVIFKEMCKKN